MLKISFTNAEVSDHGYGLEVNGKSLEDIISTALGTKVKGNGGYGSGLPSFSSNIVSWETGKTAPKMEKAQELSDLYGIPLAYMDFSKVGNSTPLRERESEPQIPAF